MVFLGGLGRSRGFSTLDLDLRVMISYLLALLEVFMGVHLLYVSFESTLGEPQRLQYGLWDMAETS